MKGAFVETLHCATVTNNQSTTQSTSCLSLFYTFLSKLQSEKPNVMKFQFRLAGPTNIGLPCLLLYVITREKLNYPRNSVAYLRVSLTSVGIV